MARNVVRDTTLISLSGLYSRIARQMGVHPSYVSRVARGERRSEPISQAIATELTRFLPAGQAGREPTASGSPDIDLRKRLLRRLKSNPQITKLSAMVIDLEHWASRGHISHVSRVSLQSRIAANAALIATAIEQFQRLSQKMKSFPHVLSLTDGDGVVLYSTGETAMVLEQGRVPGSNWSRDCMGPSVAARAIAAGVPLIIIGTPDNPGGLLPVRMGSPIRLTDTRVAGVVVLSMELGPTRAEHLMDLCKAARKICKVVERDRKRTLRALPHSPVQPFEEAEVHLARVMSMPQMDPATRSRLAVMLAELEEKRREFMLRGPGRSSRKGKEQATAKSV
jgi:hypothetical protein